MDNVFLSRLKDLNKKAESSCRYTFTHFMGMDELSTFKSVERELGCFTLFGGVDGAERVVARFGNPDELGYEEDFPIICIKVEPVLKKFADVLSHRDFLGAIMNLGIERDNIGDIIVNDSAAYIFVLNKMAEYVCENLDKVKHTVVKCTVVNNIPESEFYKTERVSFPVASLRLDCIIAAVYKLSRNQANELFVAKKIFVNGKLTENISHVLKEGDTVSARGLGRFVFSAVGGSSKKGKTYVYIDLYV